MSEQKRGIGVASNATGRLTANAMVLGLAASLAAVAACNDLPVARPQEAVSKKGQAVINGVDVAAPSDNGLVALQGPSGFGSGVLLDNQWTLTVAHALDHARCPLQVPTDPVNGNSRRTCRFVPNSINVVRGNLSAPTEVQ